MGHVTHMNESCHTLTSLPHTWTSHVTNIHDRHGPVQWSRHGPHSAEAAMASLPNITHVNDSCHIFMSLVCDSCRTCMSLIRVSQGHDSCYAHEWAVSHTHESVMNVNEVMSYTFISHFTHLCEMINTCEWPWQSYVMKWIIHVYDTTKRNDLSRTEETQDFTIVPVHIKHVATGVPKVSTRFSRE